MNDDEYDEDLVPPSKILLNGIPLDQLHDFGASRRRRYHSRESVIREVKRIESDIRSSSLTRNVYNQSAHRESHFGANTGLLYVSNINYDVRDCDLYSVFSSFGYVVRAANNYGIDGHSNGTALVVFANRDDAIKAYQALNGQLLKGQNLCIRLMAHNHSNGRHNDRHFWAERAENLDKEEVFGEEFNNDY